MLAFYQEYGKGGLVTGAGKVDDARIVTRIDYIAGISDNVTHLSFYVFDKRVGYKFVELGVLSK